MSTTSSSGTFPHPPSSDSPHAVTEGFACVELSNRTFYNPAQILNRNLSICTLQVFANEFKGEKPTVLEAFAATGLRSLRYWHEVTNLGQIIANDLNEKAVQSIRDNAERNGVPLITVEDFLNIQSQQESESSESSQLCGLLPYREDAIALMHCLGQFHSSHHEKLCRMSPETLPEPLLFGRRVDVIDLDPFGTAVPFVDAAMSSIKPGGLLMVTCTDSSILCGNYSETCFAKYGALPLRGDCCYVHEAAARLVLGFVARTAARHGYFIEPLLTLHINYYVRLFVRIRKGRAGAKRLVAQMAHILQCTRCPSHRLLPIARQRVAGTAKPSDLSETVSYPQLPPTKGNPSILTTPSTLSPKHCDVCGFPLKIAGPIYAGVAHQPEFLARLSEDIQRRIDEKRFPSYCPKELSSKDLSQCLQSLVSTAAQELPDVPLFVSIDRCASFLQMNTPPLAAIAAALLRLRFSVSRAVADPTALKTDAPMRNIFSILLAYRESKLGVDPNLKLKVKPEPNADFRPEGCSDLSQITKVSYVQKVPGWGPMSAKHKR